jgi:electron transfer flavoprotein alpha subunit
VVALAKQIPASEVTLAGDTGLLMRADSDAEMNAFCRRAVAMAVLLAEGGDGATVVTMGPPRAIDVLRESVAWGARHAWHLCDQQLAGADALMTAGALAAAIDLGGPFDLVLVGRNSLDGGTGSVGPMIAQMLGLPFIDSVSSITREAGALHVRAQTDTGNQSATIRLPAVLSVAERLCTPTKLPSDRWARAEQLDVRLWGAKELEQSVLFEEKSPTTVHLVRDHANGATRRPLVLDHGSPASKVAGALNALAERDALPLPRDGQARPTSWPGPTTTNDGDAGAFRPVVAIDTCGTRELRLVAAIAQLGQTSGEQTTVVVPKAGLGDRGVEVLAGCGADTIVVADYSDERPFADSLARYVASRHDVVVASSSTWGREVMGRLAAQLSMGLITEVQELHPRGSRLAGIKGAPGGGQLADIRSSSRIQLFTVRSLAGGAHAQPRSEVRLERLEVPSDDAIRDRKLEPADKWEALELANVVIGVGRGVGGDGLRRLDPLRRAVDGQYAATRKVTDQGWLPHSRQVGITGRDISPRLYIAVGISGSPNHLSGVSRAHTILAVNDEPGAAIFGQCDIGIVARWEDVVDLLARELTSRNHISQSPTALGAVVTGESAGLLRGAVRQL